MLSQLSLNIAIGSVIKSDAWMGFLQKRKLTDEFRPCRLQDKNALIAPPIPIAVQYEI